MKYYLTGLLFCFSFFIFSQEKNRQQNLETAIKNAPKNKRLVLMDSLSNYIVYNTNFESDSIVRETITLAKELDSIDILIRQTANLLSYLNYKSQNFKEAKELINNSKKYFSSLKNKELLSKFYYEAADIFYYDGDFDKSLKYYDSSFANASKYKNRFMGLSIFGKGIVYTDKGDFGNASIALKKAATIFRQKKDTAKWLDVKNSMAILYGKNGFILESKKERDELIAIAKNNKSYQNLPAVYYNNAGTANKLGLQEERVKYFKLALIASETSDNKLFFDPILKLGLAAAYAENDSLKLADVLVTEVETNHNTTKSSFLKTVYLEATMRIAFEKKQYQKAIQLAEEYLAINYASKNYDEIQKTEKFLYKIYRLLGNYEKALKSFENHSKVNDSISNVQKISTLAYYQTLYETEKRDLTIKAQKDDILLLDAQNKLKNQYLLFGGLGLFVVFGLVLAIRYKNNLKKQQQQQQQLTQDIINAQEEERSRLAFELHDGVGQQLMLLTRKSKSLQNKPIETLATDTLSNLRKISQGLHPIVLDRFGFTAAIEELVHEIDEHSTIFFTVEISNVDDYLDAKQALHIYRMFQEALNNIFKYANAKAAIITIIKNDKLITFSIQDNGKGFDYSKTLLNSKSLGMQSLIERCKIINAQLMVISEINKGTTITIKLPL